MFEAAELGHVIDEETYDNEVPKLREALLDAQYELLEAAKTPLIVVISGVEGAGKGETINELESWMDPRHIQVHPFGEPTDEERARPAMWRYWRALPPKGKIGIFFGSWYTAPIAERLAKTSKKAALEESLEGIRHFERMLTDEGAELLKFWFHLSKKEQKHRLEKLEKDKLTRWRVTAKDWALYAGYSEFRAVAEKVLRETSTGNAPWALVEGVDKRYRTLTVGKAILESLRKAIAHREPKSTTGPAAPVQSTFAKKDILDSLDLTKATPKKEYEHELDKRQRDLGLLMRNPKLAKRSAVIVFEGSDAAGKGGAIRRVTAAIDARHFHVVPIAAPSEDERAQPYLWRFWRRIPRHGEMTIFDRSWYGRVLVERVEALAPESDWQRAYSEINEFEEQLTENGAVIIKFWLQIDKDEQAKRFAAREQTGFKRFKITKEDWRNREKWDEYRIAACDMIERTSTDIAPWTLVEANDKHFARLKVLETIVDRIAKATR